VSNPIPCSDDFDFCPFCGVRPEIEPWHGGPKTKRMVACSNEDCDVSPQVTGDTDLLARDKWNRRAPAPEHAEEFASLRDQFAMAALQGILATAMPIGYRTAAEEAGEYADAMMKARKAVTP
jgi:hypothetical protein